MKPLLILWPIAAFFGLLPMFYVKGLVLFVPGLGYLGVNNNFQEYADLLLILAGHLFIFLLYGLVVLRQFQKVAIKSGKLLLAVIFSAALALSAQLFARRIADGIGSIDCGNDCASTLYALPGLSTATAATWVVLILAFIFIAAKTIIIYNKPSTKTR